jgi:hypothetical protein
MSSVVTSFNRLSEQERIAKGFVVREAPDDSLFFHHFILPGDARHRCTEFVATNNPDCCEGMYYGEKEDVWLRGP